MSAPSFTSFKTISVLPHLAALIRTDSPPFVRTVHCRPQDHTQHQHTLAIFYRFTSAPTFTIALLQPQSHIVLIRAGGGTTTRESMLLPKWLCRGNPHIKQSLLWSVFSLRKLTNKCLVFVYSIISI